MSGHGLIHPHHPFGYVQVGLVLNDIRRGVVMVVTAPVAEREGVEVLQAKVQVVLLGHQRAHGVQLGGHLVELEPLVHLLVAVDGRLAEVPHHVLVGSALLDQKNATQTHHLVPVVVLQALADALDEVLFASAMLGGDFQHLTRLALAEEEVEKQGAPGLCVGYLLQDALLLLSPHSGRVAAVRELILLVHGQVEDALAVGSPDGPRSRSGAHGEHRAGALDLPRDLGDVVQLISLHEGQQKGWASRLQQRGLAAQSTLHQAELLGLQIRTRTHTDIHIGEVGRQGTLYNCERGSVTIRALSRPPSRRDMAKAEQKLHRQSYVSVSV